MASCTPMQLRLQNTTSTWPEESAFPVMRYDAAVLNACGFKDGDELAYADFAARVKERILDAGMRRGICGDCEWDAICAKHRREP